MLSRDQLKVRCLSLQGAEEEYPFGEDTAVFKVMGKMFAILPVKGSTCISLKCDPYWATVLRKKYAAITPGYHLNKEHWNTITIDGSISSDEILDMIDESYALIVKSLTKAQRQLLVNSQK